MFRLSISVYSPIFYCFLIQLLLHSSARKQISEYFVDYNIYHNYNRYITDVNDIVNDPHNSNIVRLHSSHIKTNEGLTQSYLQLTDFSKPAQDKLKVLLVFGEHPRELVTTESFFDLVYNLTKGYHASCHTAAGRLSRFILSRLDLHLIGLLNQDGQSLSNNVYHDISSM